MKRLDLIVATLSFATAMAVSVKATAAPVDEASRLSSQYASWAGGKSNAESLVNGLRSGSSVTLITVSPDNGKSIAGFTAQTRMSSAEIARSLAAAKRTLAGMGIREPSADQIQSALIGGEVTLPNGKTKLVQGVVALRAEPVLGPVASR